jgi:hypothetical protein
VERRRNACTREQPPRYLIRPASRGIRVNLSGSRVGASLCGSCFLLARREPVLGPLHHDKERRDEQSGEASRGDHAGEHRDAEANDVIRIGRNRARAMCHRNHRPVVLNPSARRGRCIMPPGPRWA